VIDHKAIALAFASALDARDAGRVARLIEAHPAAPGAKTGKARLKTVDAVLSLDRRGTLADGGDAVLSDGLNLWTCSPADRAVVAALNLRVVERILKVSYVQDYNKGLGRKIGAQRLAPHPKRLTIQVLPPHGKKPLAEFEGKTEVNSVQLPPEGITEEDVWRRLLEPLTDALRAALLADSR
jgi:hypothetical protein